jgi:hypothetical protein
VYLLTAAPQKGYAKCNKNQGFIRATIDALLLSYVGENAYRKDARGNQQYGRCAIGWRMIIYLFAALYPPNEFSIENAFSSLKGE